MPQRETGKQRAQRIPPDYFRGGNLLDRGRVILAAVAAAAALGWWGLGIVANHHADLWASPGRVAAAHATIETNCSACHVDFVPIRDDAWAKSWSSDLRATDQKCLKCHHDLSHDKANPLGHHLTTNSGQLACSTCHHEHLGPSHALARTADSSCTMCHGRQNVAELLVHHEQSLLAKGAAPWSKITAFDRDHPDFRSISTADPRKLKFSAFTHRLHMTPGMGIDTDHKPVFTAGMLSAADKPRYAPGQKDAELVKLDCGACHQPQSSGFGIKQIAGLPSAVLPTQSSGAYLLPIIYENQCQACHPLTIDPSAGLKAGSGGEWETVPHRLSRDKLAFAVRSHWEHLYLKDHPEQVQTLLPKPDHHYADNKQADQWINERVIASLNHLRATCQKCHEYNEKPSVGPALYDKLADELLPPVLPVAIPRPWLQYAQFSHAAHRSASFDGRTIRCADCHRGADVDEQSPATGSGNSESDRSKPMLPQRDMCLKCHTSRSESSDSSPGGARTDCAECHRYHNRDTRWSSRFSVPPQPED
jgi:hypothetical protein